MVHIATPRTQKITSGSISWDLTIYKLVDCNLKYMNGPAGDGLGLWGERGNRVRAWVAKGLAKGKGTGIFTQCGLVSMA